MKKLLVTLVFLTGIQACDSYEIEDCLEGDVRENACEKLYEKLTEEWSHCKGSKDHEWNELIVESFDNWLFRCQDEGHCILQSELSECLETNMLCTTYGIFKSYDLGIPEECTNPLNIYINY